MRLIIRYSLLLCFLSINTIGINAFNSKIYIENECEGDFELTILNEKDTLLNKFIINKKGVVVYKHPELKRIKLLINSNWFYLMPQKKHKIFINRNCNTEFRDLENNIFNIGNGTAWQMRSENRKNAQKIFSDKSLTIEEKDSIGQIFRKNQEDIKNYEFEYCLDNINSIAGFIMLQEFIEDKYLEKDKLIKLADKFSLNSKSFPKKYRKEFKILEKKLRLPDMSIGDTLTNIVTEEHSVHIPDNKVLIVGLCERCYFSKLYFKEMKKDLDKFSNYTVIIFDTSNSKSIASFCLENNWTYVYSEDIVSSDLSYRLWFNGTPFSILLDNNTIKHIERGYSKDNILNKL